MTKPHSNSISIETYRYGCNNAPRPIANAPVLDKDGKELGFNFTMSTDCRYDKKLVDTACGNCRHAVKIEHKLKFLQATVSDYGVFIYSYISKVDESSEEISEERMIESLTNVEFEDFEEIFCRISSDGKIGYLGYRYNCIEHHEKFVKFYVLSPDEKTGHLKALEIKPSSGKITQVSVMDNESVNTITLFINTTTTSLTKSDTVDHLVFRQGQLADSVKAIRFSTQPDLQSTSFKYEKDNQQLSW